MMVSLTVWTRGTTGSELQNKSKLVCPQSTTHGGKSLRVRNSEIYRTTITRVMNGGGVKLSANCPDDCPKIWTWEKMLSSVSFWSELPVKVRQHFRGCDASRFRSTFSSFDVNLFHRILKSLKMKHIELLVLYLVNTVSGKWLNSAFWFFLLWLWWHTVQLYFHCVTMTQHSLSNMLCVWCLYCNIGARLAAVRCLRVFLPVILTVDACWGLGWHKKAPLFQSEYLIVRLWKRQH